MKVLESLMVQKKHQKGIDEGSRIPHGSEEASKGH